MSSSARTSSGSEPGEVSAAPEAVYSIELDAITQGMRDEIERFHAEMIALDVFSHPPD